MNNYIIISCKLLQNKAYRYLDWVESSLYEERKNIISQQQIKSCKRLWRKIFALGPISLKQAELELSRKYSFFSKNLLDWGCFDEKIKQAQYLVKACDYRMFVGLNDIAILPRQLDLIEIPGQKLTRYR